MRAGKTAPPIIDITRNEEPSLVYGPRCLTLKAKIVGKKIEWKKPRKTRAQMGAAPTASNTIVRHVNAANPKSESTLGAGMCFIMADPVNLPTMKPSKCSFK